MYVCQNLQCPLNRCSTVYKERVIQLQALETMVTHYVDTKEYKESKEIVEDFTTDLSSEGANELATDLKE